VGLPLSLSFALGGYQTIGVDVNETLVNHLNEAVTDLQEQYLGQNIGTILAHQLQNDYYRATTNAAAVKDCSDIIVTVGIPIINGRPMLLHLQTACQAIGRNLKQNDLVLLRSTVIPGTTEEFVLPILEKESGLKAGQDFQLAYSPERIAEGRAFEEIAHMPTLVAGINGESVSRAKELLSLVCKAEIITAGSIQVVETVKVFENLQRDANIAISQELARFTEALGIDIFEVIRLANTHKRVTLLNPGPGVGGYCIPNAYHYIAVKAAELGVPLDILQLCREKNSRLPGFIVNKLVSLLKTVGKELNQSKIAVLGLAMKDFSNDDRISPPVDICNILMARGADVQAYDPVVPTKYQFKVDTLEEALDGASAVMILARQNGYEHIECSYMTSLMNPNPVCLDTKAVVSWEDAGKNQMVYWRI
jgi:UDP-N-acetyl-D-mannosaminuronic acid dehydrogenase